MKTIKLLAALTFILLAGPLKAQPLVGFNMTEPPLWGPVGCTVERYYYLPRVEAYYDLDTSMFIYFSHGVWVRRKHLPLRYKSYDLYKGYKVVMNSYHGESPYLHFNDHKRKYNKNYQGAPQQTNGQRPGRKSNKSKTEDS